MKQRRLAQERFTSADSASKDHRKRRRDACKSRDLSLGRFLDGAKDGTCPFPSAQKRTLSTNRRARPGQYPWHNFFCGDGGVANAETKRHHAQGTVRAAVAVGGIEPSNLYAHPILGTSGPCLTLARREGVFCACSTNPKPERNNL